MKNWKAYRVYSTQMRGVYDCHGWKVGSKSWATEARGCRATNRYKVAASVQPTATVLANRKDAATNLSDLVSSCTEHAQIDQPTKHLAD